MCTWKMCGFCHCVTVIHMGNKYIYMCVYLHPSFWQKVSKILISSQAVEEGESLVLILDL